jgi:hypothetical protein
MSHRWQATDIIEEGRKTGCGSLMDLLITWPTGLSILAMQTEAEMKSVCSDMALNMECIHPLIVTALLPT